MDTNTNEKTNSTVPTVPVPNDAETTAVITSITQLETLVSALPKPYNPDQQNPNPNPNNPITQYANFVRALSATSDDSLIRHFVKTLNGLGLLADWWAHMGDDVSISTADVSMMLLKSLERVTVEPDLPGLEKMVNLLSLLALNANPKVKETASVLYEKWNVTVTNAGTDSSNEESVKDESTNPNPNSVQDATQTETLIHKEEEGEAGEKTSSDPSSPNYSSDSVPEPVPVRTPVPDKKKEKPSGTAYNDDDMDALEIARQVAIQVEEEVVQYRESLYSSPEQEEQKDQTEPTQKDKKEEKSVDLPLTESKPEKDKKPAVDPPLTESKSEKDSKPNCVDPVKPDKFEGLDLNENLCTDHDAAEPCEPSEGPIHVSASKGVPPVSASVPVSPRRFGTGTGWKGAAAATSAFRPAGSAGTGTGRTDSGLKRDSSFLGFDLNVAEGDEFAGTGTGTGEVVMPPSGDSSTEVSSERAKKLKLDLNRTDDDELAGSVPVPVQVQVQVPIDQRLLWLQARPSGDQSQSSASSSSQRNPNLARDFDLNDDISEGQGQGQGQGQDRNFINILGSKLMVNNTVYNNCNNSSVPSRQATAPLTFHSFLGPTQTGPHAGPYQPYQPYQQYNSQMSPNGFVYQHNLVPAPQNWYGQASTSYMLPVPTQFARQMAGPVPVPVQENGLSVGLSLNPFRPGTDLIGGSGSGLEASSSGTGTGFRQFFVQSHGGSVPEPVRESVPVPGTGLRWRDPDCDRETGLGFRV